MAELTIDDLLGSLRNPNEKIKSLDNSKETWERIGSRDSFSELGMEPNELDSFLSEWISSNPYNNI